ncbi:unnamed protein product [Phaedon cochleariae]|uniref:General transcription factor 3C polypeptide 3 n=1 Tax=Phaedon cochleariae TaxID=80249 RepID=A0A9P0DHA2_PHACE|nr:unnamed protein product [Phaedon cochleariae]
MDYNIENMPIHIEGMELGMESSPAPGPSSVNTDESRTQIKQEVSEDELSDDDDHDDSEENEKEGIIRKDLTKLSPHLKGLMGEANLRYARGDLETAKKMCFEVIRQAPDAYESYLTLAQMYESTNSRKHKAYLMLASHLAPGNEAIACSLAELFTQDGDVDEAIKCYSRILLKKPRNLEIHMKRMQLLEQKGRTKTLLKAKQTMLKRISRNNHQQMVQLAMEIAAEYFELKNYAKAVEALQIPLRRIPKKITRDVINMMLELLLISERLVECLDIFTQYCGFTFDLTLNENNAIYLNTYTLPENVEIDLKMKFVSCLVRLRAEHLFPDLINSVLVLDNVETIGDLYLDVVDSLIQSNYPKEALKLLVPLVKSQNFSLAGVWLKYAEVLTTCEMLEQATEAYFTVMALAPSHVEILYPLAMLLLKQNKKSEALEVLSQELIGNRLDVAVLVEKMKLLKTIEDWDAYFQSAELLLSRHCIIVKYPEELHINLTRDTYKEKAVRLKKMRHLRNQDTEIETNFETIREPSLEEEYEVYKDILQTAMDRREFGVLQKFTFMGLCSKRFGKYFNEIYQMAFFSCLLNWDIFYGYTIIRDLIVRNTNNNLYWNWFGIMTSTADDLRHIRFMDRSSYHHPEITVNRRLITANHNAAMGNFIPSINFFLKEFKRTNSAYSAFMLSVVILSYYFQRSTRCKKKVLAETITYLFLNYTKLRTRFADQECFYNLGRMYHQLGVSYLAEYYYKKVFAVQNSYLDMYPEILCLKREAAYNLHCIYKKNGNFTAARNILFEHIII